MLKKFGYTNVMMLIMMIVLIIAFVDFNHLTGIDYIILSLFGILVLIHFVRIGLFVIKGRD